MKNRSWGLFLPMILVIITLMVACGSIYFLFLKHEQGTPESIASAQELRQPKNSLVGTTTMNSNGVSGGTLHTASPTLWVNKGKILPWNYVASDTEMILTADPSFNWSTFPPLVKYYDDQIVIVGYPSVKACMRMDVYARDNSKDLSHNVYQEDFEWTDRMGQKIIENVCGTDYDTNTVLISILDSRIIVWKIGDELPHVVEGSLLKSGETYKSAEGDMGTSDRQSTFDGHVLTISVYKDTGKEVNGNPVRIMKFTIQ